MILSVTVLGNKDGMSPATVGKKVVEYLEGGRTVAAPGRRPGSLVELPSPQGGSVAYYADSAGLRPGRWALGKEGDVDPAELAVLLAGYDPDTLAPLISAQGSAGRAARARVVSPAVDLELDVYSATQAAQVLGVSVSYLRRMLRQEVKTGGEATSGITRTANSAWQIDREALARLAALRNGARIVAGYDLTFSPPKSVSVVWAGGDDATRAAVLDSLDASVAAGLRYLDRHAFFVQVRKHPEQASGVIAADYLHTTSRALDPQLHHHVVVANVGTGPDGIARALDARMVFYEAKTASYVAAAELRHQLTARLGVTWTEVHNGIAEVAGVPEAALVSMSSPREDIAAATGELDYSSAKARQVAAWDTRAAKDHGVDLDALYRSWDERLTVAGYDGSTRARVLRRVDAPELFTDDVRQRIFDRLVRADGITEHEAVIDRRTVVQKLSEIAGDRLSGDAIDALADAFLGRPEIVGLEASKERSSRGIIRRGDGRVVALPGQALYSTEAMLALERRALAAYDRGREANVAVVSAETLQGTLAEERFARLSPEQRKFVAALTTSGMRIQAGLGAAGTGKTTALEAAVAAWEAAGYRVVGAAVGGTQAVVLGEETGIEGRTVASVLARYFDHGDVASIDARTILLLDEASLLSTRDFASLARAAEERGAALRLVGDPAQHSAVRAGGIFRHLVESQPGEVPALTHLYRQQGPEMAEVRLANAEYREGRFAEALERLARDGRISEAQSAEEAYDLLVSAWYQERTRRIGEPARRPSAMTAEHHFERRELNKRARALLVADGTLTGAELSVAGLSFRQGDEVIARVADRSLREQGAPRDAYVRNGSLGTVAEVREDGLVVDFARWGRVAVPLGYLERQVSPGITGGLQHAYALTTHAAQGATFAVSTPLLTDASKPEGVYVGITRGQFDLRAVTIRRRDLYEEANEHVLPTLEGETSALRALELRLESGAPERLASELHRIEPAACVVATRGEKNVEQRVEAPVRGAPRRGGRRGGATLREQASYRARRHRTTKDRHSPPRGADRGGPFGQAIVGCARAGNAFAAERIGELTKFLEEIAPRVDVLEDELVRRGIDLESVHEPRRSLVALSDDWYETDADAQIERASGPVMRP